jgi:RNA polymerase sigma-70 factor (family 1)
MHKVDLTDGSLVDLLKSDDTKAFEEIYRRYWHQLYGFVFKQTGSREEAEEIIQEVMLSLWKNRAHTQIRNLNAFLFIATRNLTNRHFREKINLRKYREYELMREVFDHVNTDAILTENQLSAAIERVLNQLPEKTATIFRMNKLNDLPVKVIAAQMGLTDKAVEYHITKSLKVIRRGLNEFVSDN